MSKGTVIVIGGGISGMTFAFEAARAGHEAIVLERSNEAGGCLHTHRPTGDFWVEMGAHTCYNSYRGLLGIIEQTAGLGRLVPRAKVPFRLLVDGAVRPIGKHIDKLELLLSAPRIFTAKKAGKTVKDFYGPIVGRKNYDRVFSRLFAAVPSQNADGFPADMLFKRRERRKDAPRSFTVERGLQTIVDELGKQAGVRVETGCEASAIRRSGAAFVVTLADGRTFEAAKVALAVPPTVASRLLGDILPDAARSLGRIRTATIATTALVVKREAIAEKPFAGLIALDDSFYSGVSRDTVPHPAWRGFAFHFRPETSEDERLSRACAALHIPRAAAEHVATRTIEMPSPAIGHADLVGEIDRAIGGTSLFVTGNFFGGLAIEDCVLRSQDEAKRLATA